jgi:hypothetical protein
MKYETYTVDELAQLIENAKIVLKVQKRNLNLEGALKTAMLLEEMRNAQANR